MHTKYFIKDDETLGLSSLLPLRVADAEEQLKTMYRSGHLSEIKKNQFGKAYLTIRKHYADLERAKVIAKKRHQADQLARYSLSFVMWHPALISPFKKDYHWRNSIIQRLNQMGIPRRHR